MYVPTSSGPLRSLVHCLRDHHDRLRALVLEEIATRKAKGIPLDDDTDFGALAVRLKDAQRACSDMDGASLKRGLLEAIKAVSGGLQDIGEYKPEPGHEDIRLRLVPVPESLRLKTNKALGMAQDPESEHAAKAEYLRLAVSEVHGLETDEGPVVVKPAEDCSLLDAADLVGPLFLAAKTFAEIEPAKKKHYGCARQPTSPSSIAALAPDASVLSAGVTAALTSTASQNRTTPALDGSGSSTPRSESGTGSTAPPMESSALKVSL